LKFLNFIDDIVERLDANAIVNWDCQKFNWCLLIRVVYFFASYVIFLHFGELESKFDGVTDSKSKILLDEDVLEIEALYFVKELGYREHGGLPIHLEAFGHLSPDVSSIAVNGACLLLIFGNVKLF
jgi:hypothetical protein